MLRENDRILTPTISYQSSTQYLIKELGHFAKKAQKQENQIVKNLGGLYIVGTERNDSRLGLITNCVVDVEDKEILELQDFF